MRISKVKAWVEAFKLSRPYTIAFKSFDSVENIIVEFQTDDGKIGLGAASPMAEVTGETFDACKTALCGDAQDWLIGRDVRQLAHLCRENRSRNTTTPAAGAAVDMALHDLLAQKLDVPLVDMLGRAHRALPTSITIGIKSIPETLLEAEEYVGRGFKILKVKLGQSLEEDVERLHTLRARYGKEIRIRVDPNQGYSRDELTEFMAKTKDLGIEFVEQPMKADDIEGMRNLPEEARRYIAADESLQTDSDALSLVSPCKACGIFNIKLMKCGGIYSALRIATVADLAGVELMWGCMDESRISIAAGLHAALACPATRYLDLDGSLDLERDVVEGGFVLEDGVMRVTDEPGLGVRLCE